MKYLLLALISYMLTGCGEESSTSQYDDFNYYSSDPVAYDYYEIANGVILHTSINTDIYNVSRLIPVYSNEHMTEHIELIEDHHIINEVLDVDEYSNVYIENYLNLETNKSYQKMHKENFGVYEIKINYCLINVNESNCETYLYVRKI